MTPKKLVLKSALSWFYPIQGKQIMQRAREFEEFIWNEERGRFESDSGLKMSLATYEFHKGKFKVIEI